jgi:hypothetical protein
VQQLFLGGRREEAAAAVPAELVERTTLIGPVEHLAERVAAYRAAGTTCLSVDLVGNDPLGTVRCLRELVDG